MAGRIVPPIEAEKDAGQARRRLICSGRCSNEDRIERGIGEVTDRARQSPRNQLPPLPGAWRGRRPTFSWESSRVSLSLRLLQTTSQIWKTFGSEQE